MDNINIFEYDSRNKGRYPSAVGELTSEQLWDLPLTGKDNKPSLNSIAQAINTELKGITEESFVTVSTDPWEQRLRNSLDVVKHIIAYKQEEAKAKAEANAKAERKAQLLEALADRERTELSSKSKEQLLQELQEINSL